MVALPLFRLVAPLSDQVLAPVRVDLRELHQVLRRRVLRRERPVRLRARAPGSGRLDGDDLRLF